MKNLKIYFACSIRGGRDDKELYSKIIEEISKYGTVLTECFGNKDLVENLSDQNIFLRDLSWIEKSDILIAEVSTPSLGVGYEICKAEDTNKKILCLYREQEGKKLSAMISGNPNLVVIKYKTFKDLADNIKKFFEIDS